MARSGIFFDDHDGFDRPKRRTRPRTKDRPNYSDRPTGRILTVDRGRYRCLVEDSIVTAAKARQLGRKAVIVGDVVHLDGDTSGKAGTLARVVEVLERTTVLRRTADDNDPFERPMVANADQLVIVTALTNPPPRPGMIDRILIAAYDAGLSPLLCLTKADLASPEELIAAYEPLGVPIVVTQEDLDPENLRNQLTDRVSVFVGHSGVGKSTLVNNLIPDAARSTGVVDNKGKGQHTSTSAIALQLPDGGWVIDTPGVRSFGLSHVTPDSVIQAFTDLESFTDGCSRGCQHTDSEPECALDIAAANDQLSPLRLASFRRVVSALLKAEQQRYD
ncbi:MAG: ribosome small subunit-dependent GTPase A [Propionibacteriaceae bacterium]